MFEEEFQFELQESEDQNNECYFASQECLSLESSLSKSEFLDPDLKLVP